MNFSFIVISIKLAQTLPCKQILERV